jgi:hypothetical protein
MAANQLRITNTHVAAEFTRLFGPAPLVKIEDKTIYEALLGGLAQEERPQSFIARILLRDVADLLYQRLWLRSLYGRLIRQAHKEKIREDVHNFIKYTDLLKSVKRGCDKAEIDKIDAYKQKHITELNKAKEGPVDEAALFLGWIGNYERIQRLLAALDKNLSDTLKLLDEYRDGLGQRVRQVANSVVAASLAPRSSPKRRQLQSVSLTRRSAPSSSRYTGRSIQRAQAPHR